MDADNRPSRKKKKTSLLHPAKLPSGQRFLPD
jgi:hypothetical protein